MTDPRHGTALSEARIRTMLAELGPEVYSLGDQIVHSAAFESAEWPRKFYALNRPDVEALLAQFDQARTLRVTHSSLGALIDPGIHTAERIKAYLAARGWKRVRQGGGVAQWRIETLTRAGWMQPGSVVTLLDEAADWSDYADAVARVVVDLAGLYGVGELQVLKEIVESGDA